MHGQLTRFRTTSVCVIILLSYLITVKLLKVYENALPMLNRAIFYSHLKPNRMNTSREQPADSAIFYSHLKPNRMNTSREQPADSALVKKTQRDEPPLVILINAGQGPPSSKLFPYDIFPVGKVSPDRCPMQSNCFISWDRFTINHTDTVIISHTNLGLMKKFKSERPNSFLVFFRYESPMNTNVLDKRYDNVFSFTATFQTGSDIYMPLFEVNPIQKGKEVQLGKTVNYGEGKTKMVIIFMSNCVPFRMKFVTAFRKFVNVSLIGACGKNPAICRRFDPECEEFQKSFKFYLAIENTYCSDYVTEKFYYLGLQLGLVPIVLNRGKLDDTKIAPPKSFINILDFKNTKELADYLLYLDKNDTAYNEYHHWRAEYSVTRNDRLCSACRQLWELKGEGRLNTNNVKPTVRMSEFWSRKKQCVGYAHQMFQKYLN